jgi:membrane-bound ClpP family serine protease
MFRTRLILAIISTSAEETAIWLVWRWVLPVLGIVLPAAWLVVIMAGWAIISVIIFVSGTRILRKEPLAGVLMVGSKGKVTSLLAPEGFVKIKSELWAAESEDGQLEVGAEVLVTKQEGLKLIVRKARKD